MVETDEWQEIEILYYGGKRVTIHKQDLNKIDSLSDVIDALHRAKTLTEKLENILK